MAYNYRYYAADLRQTDTQCRYYAADLRQTDTQFAQRVEDASLT
jgi:hypothetical protein